MYNELGCVCFIVLCCCWMVVAVLSHQQTLSLVIRNGLANDRLDDFVIKGCIAYHCLIFIIKKGIKIISSAMITTLHQIHVNNSPFLPSKHWRAPLKGAELVGTGGFGSRVFWAEVGPQLVKFVRALKQKTNGCWSWSRSIYQYLGESP